MPGCEALLREIRRRFAREFLDVVVLKLIGSSPRWGYEIIAEVKRVFGIKVGPGAIYPLLHSLEKEGLVESGWIMEGKRRKRVYKITQRGLRFIDSYHDFLREQLQG